MTNQTPAQVIDLPFPWREGQITMPVAAAILLSLFIHAIILSNTVPWWIMTAATPDRQSLTVSLTSNEVVPYKELIEEMPEPVSRSDLALPVENSSVEPSPVVEDKIEIKRNVSATYQPVMTSTIVDDQSTVEQSLPAIDLNAAFSIARDVGSMPFTEMISPGGGAKTKKEKIRTTVEKAWNPPPSCYMAYSGMGLLALPFLIKDTATGSGCKW